MSAKCDDTDPGGEADSPESGGGAEVGTFGSWAGPKTVFKKVKEWICDGECDDTKFEAFILYTSTLAESDAEERFFVSEDGWEEGPAKWD